MYWMLYILFLWMSPVLHVQAQAQAHAPAPALAPAPTHAPAPDPALVHAPTHAKTPAPAPAPALVHAPTHAKTKTPTKTPAKTPAKAFAQEEPSQNQSQNQAQNRDQYQTSDPIELYISQGETIDLPIPEDQKIKVKGKKIIHIEDRGSKIKIRGLDLGQCTLTTGHTTKTIYVVEKNKMEFFNELNKKLEKMMDLKTRWHKGRINIIGQLHRLHDWQTITELAEQHRVDYLWQTQVDDDVKINSQPWLREKLREHGLSLPHLTWSPAFRAHLPLEYQSENESWTLALSTLGIDHTFEKSLLNTMPLVRVRIVVAEVNKKLQSQLGVEWPDMISAQLAPKLKGPASLEVFLKAMEQKGLGQILASPNLLARSGSEADFLAGGEFAIKVITPRMREVIWKRHGIYLKIKPEADRSGRLSIALSTEVSLIDPSQSVDGVPGLKTNRMSTHFDLYEPRTIVLSGLIRQDWGESQSGLYGLSRLPLIGGLFGSKDFHNNKSELVIFVTPEILGDHDESPTVSWPKIGVPHE